VPLRALLVTGFRGEIPQGDPLATAGFALRTRVLETEVPSPPLTPEELNVDVVLIGSLLTEHPEGQPFLEANAAALLSFVRAGGVLVELEQRRSAPIPFLPAELQTRRTVLGAGEIHVVEPPHPLVAGIPTEALRRLGRAWQFEPALGFRALLASDLDGRLPIAMEASCGKGRIVLISLGADRASRIGGTVAQPFLEAARAFSQALEPYVRLVRAGRAPRVRPTPPYRPRPPLPFERGAWTLAVLPDTQGYSEHHPETFEAETRWIARNRGPRRIAFVAHVGDVVEHDVPEEWAVADRSLALLDGIVPYAIAPGNHDFAPRRPEDGRERATLLDTFFPTSRFRRTAAFRGVYPGEPDRTWNSYWTFEAAGQEWLVLALEFGPRRPVVAWAREILARYPERRAILVTHAYLYSDDTRYDLEGRTYQHFNPRHYNWLQNVPGRMYDGEGLWRDLVSSQPSVAFVLSGHVLNDGVGRLASRGLAGNVVHQLLANYQNGPNGGDGFLRLLEFQRDGRRVYVKTYSPLRDEYKTDAQNQFVLELGSEAYRLRP